jgi:hypothetical protein
MPLLFLNQNAEMQSGINTNYTDLIDPVLKILNLEIKEQILSTGDPAFHKRSFSGN